jgi:hypothetical protein
MNHRLTAIAMAGSLMGAFILVPMSAVLAKPNSNLSTNLILAAKPTKDNLLQKIPFSSTLSDGSILAGTLSVTNLALQNGQLLVTGVLTGTQTKLDGTTTQVTQVFTTAATLTGGGARNKCDILFLDLGPIFLDVLGLQVDLSQITLDITAVAGAGNLLGNLLCALVGLLDRGALTDILDILTQINAIIGR